MAENILIDSNYLGDPARHRSLEELEQLFAALPPAPRDRGRVALLVCNGPGGLRATPERAYLTPEGGVPGDAWGRDEQPELEAQLAVMQLDVGETIANGQPLPLFGDNLILELDLSDANLPPGSRVKAGGAILEVTPLPHTGCRKYRARFGDAALRFISRPEIRDRHLRGIYMRVVEGGELGPGDAVEVIYRGPAGETPSS